MGKTMPCPACGGEILLSAVARSGGTVQCSECGKRFRAQRTANAQASAETGSAESSSPSSPTPALQRRPRQPAEQEGEQIADIKANRQAASRRKAERATSRTSARRAAAGENASAQARSAQRSRSSARSSDAGRPRAKRRAAAGNKRPAGDPRELREELIGGIQGAIPRVRVSMAYRAGIVLVMFVMVLLPLAYIALIGAVGYGVYWHAINDFGILSTDINGLTYRNRGRAFVAALLVYAAPMFIGGLLILFMLKPLFSRPFHPGKMRTLRREHEPLLFEFVDRLCDAVHAPRPRRIEVDLQVNASASFGGGLLSLLGSNLVLTIGLPLVAGLNTREFAGILAHEFGHFAQGAGMRVTYIIRTISMWFARVVYERDEWDMRLEQWSRQLDFRISWIFYLTRLLVWLTRGVLWVLMMIGHAVAGFMLREMEFDADRHGIYFSGTPTFIKTQRMLPRLILASEQAWNELGDFYRAGRLVDNLPQLVAHNAEHLPREALEFLRQQAEESETGLFDTHPCERDRIASAKQDPAPGIFRIERPASVLFRKFSSLCRATTVDLYREIFGRNFDPQTLAPVATLHAQQEAETSDHKTFSRFFQGHFAFGRPVALSQYDIVPPTDYDEAVERVKRARQAMEDAFEDIGPKYEARQKARLRLLDARLARQLFDLDLDIPPGALDIHVPNPTRAARIETQAESRMEALAPALEDFENMAVERLTAALSLLHAPQFARVLPNAESLRDRSLELCDVLQAIAEELPAVVRCFELQSLAATILQALPDPSAHPRAVRVATKRIEQAAATVRSAYTALGGYAYPFEHGQGGVPLNNFLMAEFPPKDDLRAYFEITIDFVQTLIRLYSRTLGELCGIAEQVEEAVGLPPLPDPEPDESESESQPKSKSQSRDEVDDTEPIVYEF